MGHARRAAALQRIRATSRITAPPSPPPTTRDAWEYCEADINPHTGCLWGSMYESCPGGFEGCIKHRCMFLHDTHDAINGCIALNTPWNPEEGAAGEMWDRIRADHDRTTDALADALCKATGNCASRPSGGATRRLATQRTRVFRPHRGGLRLGR